MTSNEEINRLMAECPNISRQTPQSMDEYMKLHDENPRDYEDIDEYDDYEPDYERRAEIDEAMLWGI